MIKNYTRGHEIYYDEKNEVWRFSNNDADVSNDRPCVKCKKQSIDDVDFCLYGLHDCDFIAAACCGHGVKKGYILLKDGRRFEEVDGDVNDWNKIINWKFFKRK